MDPFLKAVGGKRWLAAELAREIIAIDPVLYVEPFVGGGAVALTLPPKLPKYVTDSNPAFIAVWRALRALDPKYTFEALALLRSRFPETAFGYTKAREALNTLLVKDSRSLEDDHALAMLTLHINVRCFNGLWRVNQLGQFNVFWNRAKRPREIGFVELVQYRELLANVTAECGDFRVALDATLGKAPRALRPRVVVYADPPYDETFDGYASGGFDEQDQRDLARWLKHLHAVGIKIIATNSDTPLVRELYAWAKLSPLVEQHNVGATAARRGKRECLIIRGG